MQPNGCISINFDQNNLCLKRVLAPIRQTLIFIKVFISNCCWILTNSILLSKCMSISWQFWLKIDQETQNNLCLKRVLAPIRQTLIFIKVFISNWCAIYLILREIKQFLMISKEIYLFLKLNAWNSRHLTAPNRCLRLHEIDRN